MTTRHGIRFLRVLLAIAGLFRTPNVQAGCGCAKPPPPPAQVRPNVTYAGTPVTLFSSAFASNVDYLVTFTSGVTGATASVAAQVVYRRDLADGVVKPQLVVTVPSLPLGPTSIKAVRANQAVRDVLIDDSQFTVAPPPLALPGQYGSWHFPNYQAAVGRDGVAYISLDMTAVAQPEVFEARAAGYPLRFGAQNVIFYNVQGFLMQLLTQAGTANAREPVPGMFVFPAAAPASDSDALHYSRHEFTTYFLQHQERQPHAVDPTDGNWHMDGSRHVDHNHLILSIAGHLNDGTTPAPGATPPFDFVATVYSLFYRGLVGVSSISMSGSATTDSFDPRTGAFGSDGDVLTNGKLSMSNTATVNGDATAASYNMSGSSQATGTMTLLTTPESFMQIKVPDLLPDLGAIALNGQSQTIVGPGSFRLSSLAITNSSSTLYVDNSAGPVTLYVLGKVSVSGGGKIQVADPDPERFAVYVASTQPVSVTGGGTGSRFYGVVYAPTSSLSVTGNGEFFGAFVGAATTANGSSRVHYDVALRPQ